MATLNSRVARVQVALGNRADLAAGNPSQIAQWLADSYTDLVYGVDFTEVDGPLSGQLSPGSNAQLAFPIQARAVKVFTIYDPTSNAPVVLDRKDMKFVRQSFNSSNRGQPSIYAEEGGIIYLDNDPDKAYNYIMDCWLKPIITQDLVSTVMLIPDDWLEIVDIGAIMRGQAIGLGNRDKAAELQQLMFGYSNPATGIVVPGMVQEKLTRRQATAPSMDYGIRPRSTRQSYTSSR